MEIICGPPLSASKNMELSWNLLNSLKMDPRPILHFYNWQKSSATYGYFTDPAQFLNLKGIEVNDIELVRRPTGGGILFHLSDLAFGFLLPSTHPRFSINTLENYAAVNGAILEALRPKLGSLAFLMEEEVSLDKASQHFCMAKSTRYDLIIDGRKVAGGAQRRVQGGYLHQGSIHLKAIPQTLLNELLLPETCVAQAMQQNTVPDLMIDLDELKQSLTECFKEAFPAK